LKIRLNTLEKLTALSKKNFGGFWRFLSVKLGVNLFFIWFNLVQFGSIFHFFVGSKIIVIFAPQSPPKIPQKGFFVARLLPAYCK
jgi:pilus assembly protein TadC